MSSWSELDPKVVTDKIPPGWLGPDGEITLEMWLTNLNKWKNLCSLNGHDAIVSSIEFRLDEVLREIVRSFPEKYGEIPEGTRAEYEEVHPPPAAPKAKPKPKPKAKAGAGGPASAPIGDEGADEEELLDDEDLRPLYSD